ncbi:MAG: peptigoglycan-binding protein LysM, partial [Ectopseudomonas oleovorans]
MSFTVLHVLVRAVAAFRLPLAMLAASALAGCVSSPPGGVQVVDRGQNQGRAPVVQRQP